MLAGVSCFWPRIGLARPLEAGNAVSVTHTRLPPSL